MEFLYGPGYYSWLSLDHLLYVLYVHSCISSICAQIVESMAARVENSKEISKFKRARERRGRKNNFWSSKPEKLKQLHFLCSILRDYLYQFDTDNFGHSYLNGTRIVAAHPYNTTKASSSLHQHTLIFEAVLKAISMEAMFLAPFFILQFSLPVINALLLMLLFVLIIYLKREEQK